VDFREADHRYDVLKQQYRNGNLSAAQFDTQLKELMVQDRDGNWWSKHSETGKWNYYDGNSWVERNPPGYEPIMPQQPPPVREEPRVQTPVEQSSGGVPAGLWIGLGITCAIVALAYIPPLFGVLGIIFGFLARRGGMVRGGNITMIVSAACLVLGFLFGFIFALGTGY
jgi:hypothetical protein